MVIDGLDIVSLDVTGANCTAADPREAVRVTTMVFNTVSIALIPIVALVTNGLLVVCARTWDILGLTVVDTSVLRMLSCRDAQHKRAGKCDLRKHF